MRKLQIQDIIKGPVVTVQPVDTLATVNDLMASNGIRHIVVTNSDGEILGLISHRDMLRTALFANDEIPFSERETYLNETSVEEIYVRDPVVIDEDTPVEEAAQLLLENKFGCLPVVQRGKPIGIVTESDFVKLFLESNASDLEMPA